VSSYTIDNRNWSSLTSGDRIRQIELEGYLVIPDLLSLDHLEMLRSETATLETRPVDYSVHQQVCPAIQFQGGAITDLIAHRPTLTFLGELFGPDIIFVSYAYARSEPGHPGISLHTDGQPYGSQIFGFEGSVPFMVRVLYYLQDLTEDVSPFRVIPRSHLSMHADANPYKRYADHPEQVMVPVKSGSAVLINHNVFHGNFPNTGAHAREMLAIAYRPAWAGPIDRVEEWNDTDLAGLPESVRPLFGNPNTRHWNFEGGNKPAHMSNVAPGINPSRWNRP